MIKTIKVRRDATYGTAQLLHGLPINATWNCNILKALLLTGYLTSPARYRGFHLSTFWAWLRYAAAIAPLSPDLRLRRLWSRVDPHQKTILSDDFGMGIPCYYLFEQHGFEDFADTSALLDSLLGGVVTHAGKPARGPAKQPDFIAIDSNDRLHILECKGTQTPGHLHKAMQDGIAQKNNLSNGSIFTSCMVGGLFIPQAGSADSAEVVFIDPEPDERLSMLAELPRPTILSAIRRQSFAKAMSVAGLWHSATAISDSKITDSRAQFVRDLSKGELKFAGFDRTDGGWKKKTQYRTLEPNAEAEKNLKSGEADTLFDQSLLTELEVSVPDDVVALLGQAVSASGELAPDVVDGWLSSRSNSARKVHRRALRDTRDNNARLITKNVTSGWSDVSSDNSATLTTAAGISFTLSRTFAS